MGKYHCTVDLLFDWFGISCMTTEIFLFLFAKLIQTGQMGSQWYSDTSPFSIPWTNTLAYCGQPSSYEGEKIYKFGPSCLTFFATFVDQIKKNPSQRNNQILVFLFCFLIIFNFIL